MKINTPVTDHEQQFKSTQRIISTTDLKGRINYVNQDLIDISGFSEAELIGQSHNVVRHPDMPPAAFANLWEYLKQDKSWMGLVKNRCKNGDCYWVNAYVTPIFENGIKTGYQSVRTLPRREYVAQAERFYRQVREKRTSLLAKLPFAGKVALGNALGVLAVPLLQLQLSLDGPQSGLLLIPLAIIISIILTMLQCRPWQKLAKRAAGLHSNDLACMAYCGNVDYPAQIETALNALESQQLTLVESLKDSATRLDRVVQKNTAMARQNAEGLDRQEQDINQLAAAVEEMSATILEVARHAQQTSNSANGAQSQASEGRRVAVSAGEAIGRLVAEVDNAVQLIQQLKQDTDNINSIVHVIRGIADQTNLLALNAAIEAARAGEMGRGFAVVADEVRSLASRTQESTQEIESTIDALHARVDQVVGAMTQGQTQAQSGLAETNLAQEALNHIADAVASVRDMNIQIATATEEQTAVAQEINNNISNIQEASQLIADAAKESQVNSDDLEKMAKNLRTVVSYHEKT